MNYRRTLFLFSLILLTPFITRAEVDYIDQSLPGPIGLRCYPSIGEPGFTEGGISLNFTVGYTKKDQLPYIAFIQSSSGISLTRKILGTEEGKIETKLSTDSCSFVVTQANDVDHNEMNLQVNSLPRNTIPLSIGNATKAFPGSVSMKINGKPIASRYKEMRCYILNANFFVKLCNPVIR